MKPPVQPPTKENDAVLAYDRANDVVIAVVKITEGESENARHRLETWTYDTGDNRWTQMFPPREPDATGNRSRVMVYADALGMAVLENRTRSKPGPPEQQMWTYCFKPVGSGAGPWMEAPEELQLTTTSNAVRLSWRASDSEDVTGYVVYRRVGAHPWTTEYEAIAKVGADRTAYEDTTTERKTVYYYCVVAAGQKDESRMSGNPHVRFLEGR